MNSNGCVYLPMYITSSIRHLFGLGGWVGGSPSILSLFGFSEMSDNCRPPLKFTKLAKIFRARECVMCTCTVCSNCPGVQLLSLFGSQILLASPAKSQYCIVPEIPFVECTKTDPHTGEVVSCLPGEKVKTESDVPYLFSCTVNTMKKYFDQPWSSQSKAFLCKGGRWTWQELGMKGCDTDWLEVTCPGRF